MICGIDSIQILFLLLFLFLLPKEYTAYDCKDYYNYNSYDNALYRRLLLLILLLIFPCHRIAVFICIGQGSIWLYSDRGLSGLCKSGW